MAILGSKGPQRIDLSFGTVFLMQKWLQMVQNALGRQSGEAGKEKRIKHGPFNQGFESFLATFTLKTRFLVIDLFFVVI